MDQFDRASELEDLYREHCLYEQQCKSEPHPEAEGYCLNPHCCEDFDGDMTRLFCGSECAKQYASIFKRKK